MKNCKYCAEKIKDEAILCRYCGKKQENIINKMDEHFISAKKEKDTIENSKGYWLIIYLPTIILMGITIFLFFSSAGLNLKGDTPSKLIYVPFVVGVVYYSYMHYRYDDWNI